MQVDHSRGKTMGRTAPGIGIIARAALFLAVTAGSAAAQDRGPAGGEAAVNAAAQTSGELGAQDQLEIRQLIDRYTHVLDHCTNGGYDYADLFTPDGTFGVSSEWGGGAKIWFTGREQLAAAGGGGPDGCRPRRGASTYHINLHPVITPTPDGA